MPRSKDTQDTQDIEDVVPDAKGDIFEKLFGESSTPDEAKAKIVTSLMDTANIEKNTELDNFELANVSVIKAINEKVESRIMDTFVKTFLATKVSHNRLGRKEIIEIVKGERQAEAQKPIWKFWG